MTLVDVILPVGSDHKFLDLAIKSVINSTEINTRLVLIDNSVLGIANIRNRIRKTDVVIRENITGFAQALNAPIKFGHQFAEYVALMNSDDISHKERLSTQIRVLKKTKTELNICGVTNFRFARPIKPYFGSIEYSKYNPLLLTLGGYGIEPTWVANTNWWLENSHRNTNIHPDIVDLECAMGVFTKTRISSVPEKLYLYRKHGNQLSRNRAGKEDFERISQTIKEFHQHYGINYPGSDIFYFARPRNIFSDKLQKLEREKLVQYLYEVQNALFQIFHQPKIRMEITKLIDIRIQSLSPVRGASRLAINQIESLLKRPNYGI